MPLVPPRKTRPYGRVLTLLSGAAGYVIILLRSRAKALPLRPSNASSNSHRLFSPSRAVLGLASHQSKYPTFRSGIYFGGAAGYVIILLRSRAKALPLRPSNATSNSHRLFSPSRAVLGLAPVKVKIRPQGSDFYFGGAAGYCPRVRRVTYCSSTYIVLLDLFSHVIH